MICLKRLIFIVFLVTSVVGVGQAQGINPSYSLLLASERSDLYSVKLALAKKADVNTRSMEGVTPLMYAASVGNLKIVELLVEAGAEVNALPYNSPNGALMMAVQNSYIEVAEYLIMKGAVIQYEDEYKRGLLHIAAETNIWETSDLLLYYGHPVDPLDDDDRTPLMYSSFLGHPATASILMEYGANIDRKDKYSNTALHIAAYRGHNDVLKELLKYNPKCDSKNDYGYKAIDLAILSGNDSTVYMLMDYGCSPSDSITRSINALNLAQRGGNSELVDTLKKLGIKSNIKPVISQLSLGAATYTNFEDIFLGGIIGFHEDKYNIDVDLSYSFRANNYFRLMNETPIIKEYYREDRSLLGLSVTKNFDLIKPLSGHRYGFNLGVSQYVNWSWLDGHSQKPAPTLVPGFKAGVYAKIADICYLSTGFEYLNLDIKEYSALRFNVTLKWYIKLRNSINYNIIL